MTGTAQATKEGGSPQRAQRDTEEIKKAESRRRKAEGGKTYCSLPSAFCLSLCPSVSSVVNPRNRNTGTSTASPRFLPGIPFPDVLAERHAFERDGVFPGRGVVADGVLGRVVGPAPLVAFRELNQLGHVRLRLKKT